MAIIPWLKKIFFLCQALSVTIDHKSICHINGNKTRGVCSLQHHTSGFCSMVIALLGCQARWSLPGWSREGSTAPWHCRDRGEEPRAHPSITGVTRVTAESWARAHCRPPHTTHIQKELFEILAVPCCSMVLQGEGLYLWVPLCILIRIKLFTHCIDCQSPTKWCWSCFSFPCKIPRNTALQKTLSPSEVFLFF